MRGTRCVRWCQSTQPRAHPHPEAHPEAHIQPVVLQELGYNGLTGTIPAQISALTALTKMCVPLILNVPFQSIEIVGHATCIHLVSSHIVV